ncbi:hypothetical protein EC846_3154 [Acinetobacter sp. BIGb0102]|uniref:hypothetical protein n=1 Tax=Acinetobacter sp. BIGb0102 TaxID=2485131 RepID=UPI000F4E9E80|nr:hypothetical protein [Acinetobacter sp. BIGb0102]RPE27399.1 hypothetical protein EC846_3154 [Acinetobacter sp. BIGb0102]
MIKFQEKTAENDVSIKLLFDNLSTIIQQGYILEEKVSQKIFSDIEAMILSSENSIFPEKDWQTMIWEISANFEYRELWFALTDWIHPKAEDGTVSITQSYAFFKLTHCNREYNYNPNEEFQINNSRFPTANFFRHDLGYITIQFCLNYNLIHELSYQYNHLTKGVADLRTYRARQEWNKFRENTLIQYKNLENKGFELGKYGTFFEMKIDALDSELFVKEYEQGKLDKTLEPIEKVLRKVNESFDIFDDIQNEAKKYYLDLMKVQV